MNNTKADFISAPAEAQQLSRHAGLSSWLLDGRLVIFDSTSLELAIYTSSAAVIWLLLDQGAQIREHLAREFAEIYALSENQALNDMKQCLDDWHARGWLLTDEDGSIVIQNRSVRPETGENECVSATLHNSSGKTLHRVTYQLYEAAFTLTLTEGSQQDPTGLAARLQMLAQGFPVCRDPKKLKQAPVLQIITRDEQTFILKNNVLILATHDRRHAYADIVRHIFQLAYPGVAPLAILHAAALSREKTILFAGISGSGKSTISAYLTSQGWNYHGDDTVGLACFAKDSDKGSVLPFPTSVSIKEGSLQALATLYPALCGLSEVDYNNKTARFLPLLATLPVDDASTLEIAALVFPTFTQTAATNTERITAAEALSMLIDSGIAFDKELTPAAMHQFLVILSTLPIYKLVYSDLHEAQRWLDILVAK